MAIGVLLINLLLPTVASRRWVARAASRVFLRAVGLRIDAEGLHRLPSKPCVIIANHASYLDGLVLAAVLPPRFAFIIKKEMTRVPGANLFLRGLGSEFVERFDRHKSAVDARRVVRRAGTGQSMVFFPEGTFNGRRAIGKFHGGAFATAARNHMPIVAMAIIGTRDALPSGTLLMRRAPIRVAVLEGLDSRELQGAGRELRHKARSLIAAAVGEELAA